MKTNKPVAYLHTDGSLIKVDPRVEFIDPDFIPLYTHPHSAESVKVKELTAEEIWEIFTHLARSPDLRTDMIRFADAILRKAQEK